MKNLSRPRQIVARLLVVNLLLLAASAIWYMAAPTTDSVAIAAAKGKAMLDMNLMADFPFDAAVIGQETAVTNTMIDLLAGKNYEFVNAVPLSLGEARPWQEFGCGQENCAHVTYYNYTDGGTINGIVNLDTDEVVGGWVDWLARPSGSSHIVDKAMAIAADDEEVRSTLGDIGAVDPAMVPMSGWLYDDDCRENWCVDLSFHSPAGDGRIYHVFVNMEQEIVARTFYTRGRENRSAAPALQPGPAYSDGCTEQYGWSVCWEMTAHDGILFRDATYQGTTIFSSIKIPQIEAWYPGWPGGYRDEIGFAASVPPFGGTQINDLGEAFEIRQLFTEFTYWPNCICCYRYEEIIRFYADGSFEPRFISHGPGCDDLSIYRPFWRIDLDLDGPENDSIWLWQQDKWIEVTSETEIYPFVDDLSPDGEKLATYDGDVSYRWHMQRTDPLGLDESRFFILQKKEGEGDGPVTTGPGDTFQPPRQWLGNDSVSGGDVVFWYVPLLKTKKGGPWWCMPDPDPDFSPCEAILRIETAGELTQPSAAEIAEATAQAIPTTPPEPTAIPAPTPTPRPIEGESPEEIVLNAGCGACHHIGSLGEEHKVGPDLTTIGAVAQTRITGMSAEAYLRQSILEPNTYLVEDCPNGPCIANIMPRDYATRLTPQQIDIIVNYLLALTGDESDVTVIGEGSNGTDGAPAPKAFPAPKMVSGQSQKNTAGLAVQILLLTLVFLLSLFRLLKRPSSED